MLIDTGAASTFIHRSQLQHIRIRERTRGDIHFKLADGSTPFTTNGKVVFPLRIGGIVTYVHAYVTDRLSCDCIIGSDWIAQYGVDIHTRSNRIVVHTRHDSAEYPLDDDVRDVPIRLVGSIRLAPGQEVVVDASAPISSMPFSMIRPHSKFNGCRPLRLPDAIVCIGGYRTSIVLYNSGTRTQELAPRTVLGYIDGNVAAVQPVESCSSNSINAVTATDKGTPKRIADDISAFIDEAVKHIDDDGRRQQALDTLRKRHELFDVATATTAITSMNHAIRTLDHPPIASKPHAQSHKQRLEVERQVEQLLKDRKIRPSDSPWAAPILLARKKDGSERLVVDYRRLNEVTVKDSYPLPTIEETLTQLGGHTFFTKLDLRAGYHQIPIRECDKPKTAFVTKNALFEWNVLPPGLKNAPPSFQRCMSNIIGRARSHFCLIYLDDIIVFSRTFEEHVVHVADVLETLYKHRLRLHPAKCHFFRKKIDYLGHLIDAEGLHPLDEKIVAIRDFPMPTTLKEANAFIGLVGWYRRFIPDFAKVAGPIHMVTNKTKGRRKEFFWADAQATAFDQLKTIVTSAPLVLDFPDPTAPFVLSTDASDVGAGAVLKQTIDGKQRVVYYFSQLFNRTQKNYSTIEREALAIWLAVNKLRPYLLTSEFVIETDHCPLCDFYRKKCRNRRIDCWGVLLADYNISGVKYKRGKCNCDADFLSRYPRAADDDELELSTNAITRAMTRQQGQNACQAKSNDSARDSALAGERQSPNLSPIDLSNVRAAQVKDDDVQQRIAEQIRSASDDLCVNNGVLLKILKNGRRVPWIPRALVPDVLQAFHNHPTAAHFGRDRTYDKLRSTRVLAADV